MTTAVVELIGSHDRGPPEQRVERIGDPYLMPLNPHEVPSDGGGRTFATIATLLTTAKMNQVDPHAWLTQTLERIANGWPNSDALMPWNYQR